MPKILRGPILRIPAPNRGEHTIAAAPTSIAAFVGPTATGPLNKPELIQSFTNFQSAFGGLDTGSELSYAVQHFFLNFGTQAWIVRTPTASAADLIGDPDATTGLHALTEDDAFNLLCLPDASNSDNPSGIYEAAIKLCQERRAFLLVDPPASVNTAAAASAWIAALGLTEPDGAAFFPRLSMTDDLNGGAARTFAPSGVVAGLYARNDALHGVWKSPAGAGMTLTGVLGLACPLTDAENDQLNALGLNCFRIFPQHGAVLWGARTLAGADTTGSQYKYVPVRRTALFIESSILTGIMWVVFEPNGEPLWAQLRLSVGSFMQQLFRQGAFQGNTPSQAYFVKCDREIMTQTDVDSGVVTILVGFAPLRPAEFVILRLSQRVGPAPA